VTFVGNPEGEFWPIRAAKGEDAIGLEVTHYKLRVSWSTPKFEAVGFSETQEKKYCCCGNVALKTVSHIKCRARAFPLPCRAAKGLECVFHI